MQGGRKEGRERAKFFGQADHVTIVAVIVFRGTQPVLSLF